MAAQSEITEKYSTLECDLGDVTVNGLEVDHAIIAPELDGAVLARQAVFYTGLEVAYDDSPRLPQALDESEDGNDNRTSSKVPKARRLSKRTIIMTLVSFAVTAAALGVGVYFGRRAKAPTSLVQPTSEPSNAPFTQHGILNDSSLAALSLPNGDRRLFYQDYTGQINQAAYSSSSRKWPLTLTSVVASDAKNYTPLAAVNLVGEAKIYLIYVSTNGSLAAAMRTGDGWSRPSHKNGFRDGRISQFVAGTDSRSLTVTEIPDQNSTRIFLVYENSDGFVSMMEGTAFLSATGFLDWEWQDLTRKFQSSIPSIMPRSRFASLYTFYGVTTVFYGNESRTQKVVYYNNGTFKEGTSKDTSVSYSIGNSEKVLVNTQAKDEVPIWGAISVNETRLVCQPLDGYTVIRDSPASSYPNSRLAAASGSSSIFRVYHQINDNTFGEDEGDRSVGGWIQSNFTVPTS
ncbi:hypothetical protein MMC22_003148 [Lobaria immixta]|nr:hypothetical protein [Lobaria immixta]